MTLWGDLLPSDPLDPFLTVAPNRLILEGFRSSGSVYTALIIDTKMFDIKEGTICGTSQVPFPSQLWKDLEDLRSSRETSLIVGTEAPSAFIGTAGTSGGAALPPAEISRRPAEVSPGFLARCLQYPEYLGKPGVRLEIAPMDLAEILNDLGPLERFCDASACRLEKGADGQSRIVLEPWEKSYRLSGQPRGIPWEAPVRIPGEFRNWAILNDLVPYADSAHLQFSNRNGPLFCWLKCGMVTLILGMGERTWSSPSDARPMTVAEEVPRLSGALLERARHHLSSAPSGTAAHLARNLAIDEETATGLLVRLCRQGHCFFDVQARIYRHRELFEPALPESSLFEMPPQAEMAQELWESKAVTIHLCFKHGTMRKGRLKLPGRLPGRKRIDWKWHIHGQAGDCTDVRIVVNPNGSLASGFCTCSFYEENLMQAGPCQHMTALLLASAAERVDLPSSIPIGGSIVL